MKIIIKYDFDCLENYNPEYSEIVGIIEDSKVDEYINNQKKEYYQGYNGKMYPYYIKESISTLVV